MSPAPHEPLVAGWTVGNGDPGLPVSPAGPDPMDPGSRLPERWRLSKPGMPKGDRVAQGETLYDPVSLYAFPLPSRIPGG